MPPCAISKPLSISLRTFILSTHLPASTKTRLIPSHWLNQSRLYMVSTIRSANVWLLILSEAAKVKKLECTVRRPGGASSKIFVTLYEQKLFKIFLQNKIATVLYVYFHALNRRSIDEHPVFTAFPATEE